MVYERLFAAYSQAYFNLWIYTQYHPCRVSIYESLLREKKSDYKAIGYLDQSIVGPQVAAEAARVFLRGGSFSLNFHHLPELASGTFLNTGVNAPEHMRSLLLWLTFDPTGTLHLSHTEFEKALGDKTSENYQFRSCLELLLQFHCLEEVYMVSRHYLSRNLYQDEIDFRHFMPVMRRLRENGVEVNLEVMADCWALDFDGILEYTNHDMGGHDVIYEEYRARR